VGTPQEGKGAQEGKTSAPHCAALIELAMEFRSMAESAERKEIKKAKRASCHPLI
jgi:hypothetical protein